MFLHGLTECLYQIFRILKWPTGKDLLQSVISELLQFTILSLVETVGLDEQPLSFDVIDYLTLELQHGPHADGSIGQHVHEPSVGFTVCCGFNH